jgi:acetyltransferase-like isoleucine patch superfamily enzyme
MGFWSLLDGGISVPKADTVGRRIALWFGYWLAARHKRVSIGPKCHISPEARVHPRDGAISIGSHTSIAHGVFVQGNISIGSNCSIQARSILVGYGTPEDPTGQITIGNCVRIAPHVLMFATNHIFDDPLRPIYCQGSKHAPIIIERDVWIAAGVIITAGTTIGQGAIIGAGSVVTRDISPFSISAGIPAKLIGTRASSESGPA